MDSGSQVVLVVAGERALRRKYYILISFSLSVLHEAGEKKTEPAERSNREFAWADDNSRLTPRTTEIPLHIPDLRLSVRYPSCLSWTIDLARKEPGSEANQLGTWKLRHQSCSAHPVPQLSIMDVSAADSREHHYLIYPNPPYFSLTLLSFSSIPLPPLFATSPSPPVTSRDLTSNCVISPA